MENKCTFNTTNFADCPLYKQYKAGCGECKLYPDSEHFLCKDVKTKSQIEKLYRYGCCQCEYDDGYLNCKPMTNKECSPHTKVKFKLKALLQPTPSGIPTDDEIQKYAYDQSEQNICGDYERGIAKGKVLGAKWMREQLTK